MKAESKGRDRVDPNDSDLAMSKASPAAGFSVSGPIKSYFCLSHLELDYGLSVEGLLANLIAQAALTLRTNAVKRQPLHFFYTSVILLYT